MRTFQHHKQTFEYLKARGNTPAPVMKAFGDLVEDAEAAYATNPRGLFQGAPGGVLQTTPVIPSFKNYNTTFIAPFSIANVSTLLLPSNKLRTMLIIQNLSLSANLFFNLGSGASIFNGILLIPQAGFVFDSVCPSDSLNAYFDNTLVQQGVVLEVRFTP
jgi:hypothetical protein